MAGPAEGGNEPGEVEVGDRFLVLVAMCDRHAPERVHWDPWVIVANEKGWDDPDGESWCAWDWPDVSWWMSLGRHNLPPLPAYTERKAR